jgi:hypothetical protein
MTMALGMRARPSDIDVAVDAIFMSFKDSEQSG